MPARRGKVVAIIAGAGLLSVGVAAAFFWEAIYYHLYPEKLLIGIWQTDVRNARFEDGSKLANKLTRSEDEDLLLREEGLTFRLERDLRLYLWWTEPYTTEGEPPMSYRLENRRIVFELGDGIERGYGFRFEFRQFDKLTLLGEVDGKTILIPCRRVAIE